MKIFVGSDHAGFKFKQVLVKHLTETGYEVIDKGAFEYDKDDDYPNYVIPIAEEVAKDSDARGIVLGGSGQGEAMATDRLPGIRTAVWYGGDMDIVRLSREHNDSNILSLGARFISEEEAIQAVKLWLETPFSGDERHVRRISKF